MSICEHQSCNRDTDYEIVKCSDAATHRVSWPDGASEIYCEEHARQCRVILSEMESRGTAKVIPEIVRLMHKIL